MAVLVVVVVIVVVAVVVVAGGGSGGGSGGGGGGGESGWADLAAVGLSCFASARNIAEPIYGHLALAQDCSRTPFDLGISSVVLT